MAIRMINPSEAKKKMDHNPVKVGMDQKQQVTISLNEATARRLGLISDSEGDTQLLGVGVDGSKVYLVPAAEGKEGFELTQTKGDLPRYTFSLHVSAMFDAEDYNIAEPFRSRIVSFVQNEEVDGVKMVSIDMTGSVLVDGDAYEEPEDKPLNSAPAPDDLQVQEPVETSAPAPEPESPVEALAEPDTASPFDQAEAAPSVNTDPTELF